MLCFIAYVTSYQSTKGILRAGRAQQNRRKNKTKIQKHPRGQNIEENDGPSTSSGPFSTSGNLLAGRSKGYDRTTLEVHFEQDNTRDEDSNMDVDGETNDEPVNIVFTEEDLQNFDIGMG